MRQHLMLNQSRLSTAGTTRARENQDQAGSPNEDGQRTLGDFGIKRQRVELSVMSKRMMILRVPDWIEQLMCFAFKRATVLRWIRRNCQVRRREFLMGVRVWRALMKKLRSVNGTGAFRRWMSR